MAIKISTIPLLKDEWDYDKNTVDIETVTSGSDIKRWWKCPKGHSYPAAPTNRVHQKSGCPYCANKKVLAGFNDLATIRPDLLELWDYDNNTIQPTEVTAVSGKEVNWKCPKGHRWPASIAHIAYGRRCPICNSEASSSFPEQAIYYYLKRIDSDVQNRYKFHNKYEIDIFIPELNIGIEYDGYRWHKSEKKKQLDAKKEEYFHKYGLRIIRVIEIVKKEQVINDFIVNEDRYYYNNDNIPVLNKIIKAIINDVFGKDIDIDIEKDRSSIYNNYLLTEKEGSVESDPTLLAKWDTEKNKDVKPSFIKKFSDKPVWWICEEGHSFPASPHAMSFGLKCPECEKEKVKQRSLAVLFPEIAKEWDHDNNDGLSPDTILPASNIEVNWICPKGHRWPAKVVARTRDYGKCNCPICSNRKIVPGINDLFTLRPALKNEWMFDKNKNLDPSHLGIGCIKRAWWKCSKCGYEWPTQIRLRATEGCGCKKCSGKQSGERTKQYALKFGTLVSSRKDLMEIWDFDKNTDIDPGKITIGVATKVWWKCPKGHDPYFKAINNVSKGHKCTKCGILQRAEARKRNNQIKKVKQQ